MQQHRHADPDSLSLHGSKERLVEGSERTQELHGRVRGTERGTTQKILQIVAGAEGGTLAAQQHRPHHLLRLRGAQRASELLVHQKGDCVALLGAIEAHLANTAGARDENWFAHAGSLRQWHPRGKRGVTFRDTSVVTELSAKGTSDAAVWATLVWATLVWAPLAPSPQGLAGVAGAPPGAGRDRKSMSLSAASQINAAHAA